MTTMFKQYPLLQYVLSEDRTPNLGCRCVTNTFLGASLLLFPISALNRESGCYDTTSKADVPAVPCPPK